MRPADASGARAARQLQSSEHESGGAVLQITDAGVALWRLGADGLVEIPRRHFQALVDWWLRDQPEPKPRAEPRKAVRP